MLGDEMWIYHERQESALCARHCLNNLLQGPFFTEFELAALAQQLDQEERELLISSDPSMIQFYEENPESNNVSADGNFSVQVLRRGLQNMNLELVQVGSSSAPEAQEHPEAEEAFICNLDAHWFAVRKVFGTWYNLNSLSGLPETPAKPTLVSDFFLSAFLSTLGREGYSIFAVRGEYPHITSDPRIDVRGTNAQWHRAREIKSRAETYPSTLLQQVARSTAGQSNLGAGDSQLRAAIQASLGDSSGSGISASGLGTGDLGMRGGFGGDADLQAAIAASLSAGPPTGSVAVAAASGGGPEPMDEDDDLQRALAMSMQAESQTDLTESTSNAVVGEEVDMEDAVEIPEEPDSTEGVCTLSLVLSNGTYERRFLLDHQLKHVSAFAKSVDPSLRGSLKFSCPPVMKGVDDIERTLDSICEELTSRRLKLRVSGE